MKIYFRKDNCNCLVFEKDKKKHHIAIPPSKIGIIKETHIFSEHYYLHSLTGYVIITNDKERFVYQNGNLICKTKLTY